MATILFKGYSSVDKKIGSTQLFDLNLAKQDLKNHFYTRQGERLMDPGFGSIIPSLLFNPMNDSLADEILDDAKRIVTTDSRFELVTLDHKINYDGNAITLNLMLHYKPENKQTAMEIQFDINADEAS